MAAQPKRTGADIKRDLHHLQHSKLPPLRIFKGEDPETVSGRNVKVEYQIEVIKPDESGGRDRWHFLHNSAHIKILAEKDYMSHRDGLTTIIRFAEYTEVEDPEDLVDDLMPE